MKRTFLLPIFFLFIASLYSCQEIEEKPNDIKLPPPSHGGKDVLDVEDFSVRLTADSLKPNEQGKWTILSGLIEDKVYFSDESDPKTFFHGMPGEEYLLLWELWKNSKKIEDTVKVSFTPLETEITESKADFHQTRIELHGKEYDRGKWTILGDYKNLVGMSTGTYKPEDEYPNIKVYGLENATIKIIWTTWYGSKSASDTLEFTSGEYQQREALESLGILDDHYYYKENENGDVIEITMLGVGRAWIFEDLERFPELQALKHLKRLILPGNPLYKFPEVITKSYHKLTYLNLSHNKIQNLPDDIGNLKELDTLVINTVPNLGKIPESFGNLKKLKYLDLVDAGITHLPESFSELTSLDYVDLNLNTIEKLPENIGNLKNLRTFRGPYLSKSIPNSFSDLSALEFCFFRVNGPNAILPEDFGKLTQLHTLWLTGDYQRLPESFSNLSNLKDFSVGNTSGLREVPQNFGNLKQLERLNLTVKLTTLPESFGNLSNLKFFILSGEIHYLPQSFGGLKNLEGFGANGCKLKELPESIGQLSKLKEIMMVYNHLTEIPASIGNLTQLHTLVLGRNRITKFPDSMANLANTLKFLAINGNNYPPSEVEKVRALLPNTEIITYLEGD
ncbi:leucine-rich repeat domain-containing protein [Algoriphagus terrigena]|uniref:leucine-rich repeat domain-containing protein n=1 Tax=Algoriphagus terrigena TaxID=344884 RepID=UPI0004139C28|nr:small GTP-binding protein [Algoriphagus terrigena]